MSDVITPDTELDLEGEGLQPCTRTLNIIDASVEENDSGTRWVVIFEPTEEVEGLMGGTVRDSGYLSHNEREDLVSIGRGSLKRLGRTVLGTATFSLADLIGEQVQGYISESDNGFARVGRYKAVK